MTGGDRAVPRVMMITPPGVVWDGRFRGALDAALQGGVDAVLVRLPGAPARDVLALADAVKRVVAAAGARLFVHDRVDVALAVGADGLHLARRSVPVSAARALLPRATIGFSAHGEAETAEAADAGADYVTVSPVFPTSSKPGVSPLGVAAARAMSSWAPVPTLWLGGVCAARLEEVGRGTGVVPHGIAAIDAFADPAHAADEARRIGAWLCG